MFSALSNSELLIMQYLWQQNVPQTFSQIKEYFAETGWKKQTINTFLIRLIQKGYLESDHSQAKTHYKSRARSWQSRSCSTWRDKESLRP